VPSFEERRVRITHRVSDGVADDDLETGGARTAEQNW